MIVIADSGSTKTNWVFIDKDKNKTLLKTVGFNPYYQTTEDIYQTLMKELVPNVPKQKILNINFYGAGCEAMEQREQVAKAIRKAFPDTEVIVDHDLLAAARAALGNEKGIACISGTGSNTCLYDGKDVVLNIHSLGLFLGDEGSGGYLGKIIAREYIRKAMPDHIRAKFEAFTTDRQAEILDKVYTKPFPNRYLASLARFVVENQKDEYVFKLAYESFEQMFDRCICRYDGYKTLPVNFVGSIAWYLRDVLYKVASDKGVSIKKIVADPMDSLTDYHYNKQYNS
ncbi:MAG: BadF/BadG/BcrA/BcrD ATPase family protein [Cytophagaceae bacterium]